MAKSKKQRDGEASLDGLPAGRNEPKTAPMSRTAVVTKPKKKSPKTAAAAAVGSSNWSALATRIGAGANPVAKKRKQERLAREESEAAGTDSNGRDAGEGAGKHRWRSEDDGVNNRVEETRVPKKKPAPTGRNTALTDLIALDCEMVGAGVDGRKSILARVSVVNEDGNVVLDTFVSPTEYVVDYRTQVSGVRPSDLKGAPGFKEIQLKMANILKGRTLIGHALKNDLKCLFLDHPKSKTRDTALFRPLTRPLRANERAQDSGIARGRGSRSLKELCASHLGLEIQGGEHSSVDDARAALLLYKKCEVAWERELRVANTGVKDSQKKKDSAKKRMMKNSDDASGSDSDDDMDAGLPAKQSKKHHNSGGVSKHRKGVRTTDPFAARAPRVDLFRR